MAACNLIPQTTTTAIHICISNASRRGIEIQNNSDIVIKTLMNIYTTYTETRHAIACSRIGLKNPQQSTALICHSITAQSTTAHTVHNRTNCMERKTDFNHDCIFPRCAA